MIQLGHLTTPPPKKGYKSHHTHTRKKHMSFFLIALQTVNRKDVLALLFLINAVAPFVA